MAGEASATYGPGSPGFQDPATNLPISSIFGESGVGNAVAAIQHRDLGTALQCSGLSGFPAFGTLPFLFSSSFHGAPV